MNWKKNLRKRRVARQQKEYWYEMIATLERKDLITTCEDTSLMTLLNNSNTLQILQRSV